MATAETAKLIASLELRDQFSKTVNSALTGITKLDRRIDTTKSKFFQVGQHVGIGIQNTAKAGLGIIAAGVTVATASLKLAGDFEAQLNTINTIARETPTGLKAIGDSVRKIARETGTSLDDLTTGYYDLLSAGVKTADATGVLTAANKLAIGGLSTTAESVDLLTTALNVYGGGAAEATKDADIFAKAIERGKVTASDLAGSFSQVGNIAKSSGISLEELGAAFARLTAGGADASDAATQIRSAIVALTKTTGPLEKLQKQTGRNYLSIAGKQGLVVALEQMRKDADKAGVPLVDLLGRVEGLNFTLATTGPNFAAYNADLAAMGDATGTAASQMAERQQGLNFQLTLLKRKAQDAGITIGSALLPKITPLLAKLNDFVNLNQGKIAEFGDKLAGLFSDKNISAGVEAIKGAFNVARDAAPAIADAAKITGSALKIAVDLFKSLPKELQGLAIAGLAVNKLTGGLVTNIAGGLIESVIKRMSAALVNVTGAVVNVNGGIGGLPIAAGGGEAAAAGAAGLGFGTIAAGIAAGTAVSALGIMGLGWLITATSSPEQMAVTQQNITNAGRRRYGLGELPPVGGDHGSSDARGMAASLDKVGHVLSDRLKDDVVNLGQLQRGALSFLSDQFKQMLAALKGARKPEDIKAAVKAAIETVIGKGRGDADSTKTLLADLKKKLGQTDDPKTRAVLKDAIAKVQAKLPAREYAQKLIRLADATLRKDESTDKKIGDLKTLQRSLLDRGLPHAAAEIGKRIDAAKRDQVYAARSTTEAIKDKDLTPKVTIKGSPITVNVRTTVADQVSSQATFKKAGNVYAL